MTLNVGESKLNKVKAEDRLTIFLSNIDSYIENSSLQKIEINDEHKEAENLTTEALQKLTNDDCYNYAYILYQYCEHISTEIGKQKIVSAWCGKSMEEIVASESSSMFGENAKFMKYELKVAHIVVENVLAKKIGEWKQVADSRIEALGNKEYMVRRKADCLIEKGKRR